MIATLVLKSSISYKKEAGLVTTILAVIVAMPMVAVIGMTSVSGLSEPGATLYTGKASTTNTYDYGYCTFWTAKRREEVGMPIPNNWGDAHTWDDGARLAEYLVD